MSKWVVSGGKKLSGIVKIDGAKNSLVAILPAAIVTRAIVKLENVTPIDDTYVIIDILKSLNVKVYYDNKSLMIIDSRNVKYIDLVDEKMQKIRASYYFMGALLSLYQKVTILGPGGCKFASRPIDLHISGFKSLGFDYDCNNQIYSFQKKEKGEKVIEFKKVSVGATINMILATCRKKGVFKLVNVASEPEIDDVINFLNKCGASIKRTKNAIEIKGVNKMHGCRHKIIQDRIEAGTYLIIGACVGENLKIKYNDSQYLTALMDLLKKVGVKIYEDGDQIVVNSCEYIEDVQVVCDAYPNLATDLQQPLSVLFAKCKKVSVLEDKIYPSRYTQIDDLTSMGFKMEVNEGKLYVHKSDELNASYVSCKDLRGGASLIVAALMAKGTSVIDNIYHIKRGYYDILNKLKRIGAIAYEKD